MLARQTEEQFKGVCQIRMINKTKGEAQDILLCRAKKPCKSVEFDFNGPRFKSWPHPV